MIAFPPFFFPDTIVWQPPDDGSEVHGDPILPNTGTPITQACFVEPVTNQPAMIAEHRLPESSKLYNIHTATDPAVGVHWLGTWQGKALRALEPAERHSNVFFRTVCLLVT